MFSPFAPLLSLFLLCFTPLTHTPTDPQMLCVTARPPGCRVDPFFFLSLCGSATSSISCQILSPFLSAVSPKQTVVWVCWGLGCSRDGCLMRHPSRRCAGVEELMDSRRAEVMPFSTPRWNGVRAGDPTLPSSPSPPCRSAPPLLPARGRSEWLPGSEVHQQPPAGQERHYTSRSEAAYGGKAGTRSCFNRG